ncbi:hypothetical protein M514_07868 [Trichuris suis]|uniref:Uncharacterized protein n=1 Tax=Trichuris suis TaxID=68888 RepID=A0A085N335_9BILA|nr:hypothetical protein M513_07868 [Trichuris suis]KFD63881.1 hypothetical protein M514_07868 [Trichuris suis]
MRWRIGESVRAFVHRLTEALDLALPGLDTRSRDRFLLQRFLSALPELHRRQLLLQGEVDSVEQAIQKTQMLLSFDEATFAPAAIVATLENASVQEKTVREEDRWGRMCREV